jgi:Mg-chelatase subunit ChlD
MTEVLFLFFHALRLICMFDTSCTKFPTSKAVAQKLPFLLRLNFDELLKPDISFSSEVITCEKCGAFLTSTSTVHKDEKLGLVYNCIFCGAINRLTSTPLSLADAIEYVHTASSASVEQEEVKSISPSGKPWIICLDVSGSMANGGLEAAKIALINMLDDIIISEVPTPLILVEFSSEVKIRNLVDGTYESIGSPLINNFSNLLEKSKYISRTINVPKERHTLERCKVHVQKLHTEGSTALGPAMAVALGLATQIDAERVILLTDGEANVGIGSMDNFSPSLLYGELADHFMTTGVFVDIVGITSGSSIGLSVIGVMSERTKGKMQYLTVDSITKQMGSLSNRRTLANDVSLRILNSEQVVIGDATGIDRSSFDVLKDTGQVHLGNIRDTTELYIQIDPDKISGEMNSIQVQIAFSDTTGQRRARVFTKTLETVGNRSEFLNSMDPTLPSTFAVQKAGEQMTSEPSLARTLHSTLEHPFLKNTVEGLKEASVLVQDSSKFQFCITRIQQFFERFRQKARTFDSAVMRCYSPPPRARIEISRDYDYVSSREASTITRDQLFS